MNDFSARLFDGGIASFAIGEHRDVVAVDPARARFAPEFLGELVERGGERIFLLVGERVQAGRLDRADLPDLLALEFETEDRTRKRLEHLPREIRERRIAGLAEIDEYAEVGRIAPALGQEPDQLLVQVVDVEAVERALAQIIDRAHRRNDLVPARLGEQRDVVADAQILVAATQVDDLYALVVGARSAP